MRVAVYARVSTEHEAQMEMARFTISFEEAKAFKASRNQGIRKNEWHDLTVAVGIRTKT